MNTQKFKSYMAAVKTLKDDYSRGYQRGLRRHYHGDKFGTEEEHQKFHSMTGVRQEIGDGYREGYAGMPPRGVHGNIGNQNAVKPDTLDTVLKCRVWSEDKAGWVKTATDEGKNLSTWVVETLNKASRH